MGRKISGDLDVARDLKPEAARLMLWVTSWKVALYNNLMIWASK
jgi:hypothetical protein